MYNIDISDLYVTSRSYYMFMTGLSYQKKVVRRLIIVVAPLDDVDVMKTMFFLSKSLMEKGFLMKLIQY